MTDGLPPHGTYARAMLHRKLREELDPACLDAQRQYTRAFRFRSGAQHDLWRCPSCGSVFEEHRCGMGDLVRADQPAGHLRVKRLPSRPGSQPYIATS